MSKEEQIINSKIKYKGIFDLQELYNMLRGHLMNANWSDPVEGGEKKYAEKTKPNGKSIEIVWSTSKDEEKGYFKLEISIQLYINGLNEIEVEKDGKKIKLDKGDIEVTIKSSITENAKDAWDENSIMFKLYEKYFIKQRIDEVKIDLYNFSNKTVDEVKKFLELYRF